MQVLSDGGRVAFVFDDNEIDEASLVQILNAMHLPFALRPAVMPDFHPGYGVTIGMVLPTRRVVIPHAVGADIGCGVLAVRTNLTLAMLPAYKIREIMGLIRSRVPVGRDWHKKPIRELGLETVDKAPICEREYVNACRQLGTLGSGNHFIELQKDEENRIWFMIHSGSRNLGKKIADHYNQIAKELNSRWYTSVDPKVDLAFLPIEEPQAKLYMTEMKCAVDFALYNRQVMAEEIRESISDAIPEALFEPPINIAHNYAAWENHYGENVIVHRKGATSARKGEIGIIPGSQGSASYIVEGLGNPKSYNSCSHGAGRKYGRKEAQRQLNLEEEIKKLDDLGVVHGIRHQEDLDEAAGAYKDIDEVMEAQKDLVKIKTKLIPIGVIKG